MEYKLAQQLKKVGFPFDFGELSGVGYIDKDVIKFPTTDELLEELGDKIFSLTKHGNIWQTNFVDGMAGETAGKTPQDALARLYIKLHE